MIIKATPRRNSGRIGTTARAAAWRPNRDQDHSNRPVSGPPTGLCRFHDGCPRKPRPSAGSASAGLCGLFPGNSMRWVPTPNCVSARCRRSNPRKNSSSIISPLPCRATFASAASMLFSSSIQNLWIDDPAAPSCLVPRRDADEHWGP